MSLVVLVDSDAPRSIRRTRRIAKPSQHQARLVRQRGGRDFQRHLGAEREFRAHESGHADQRQRRGQPRDGDHRAQPFGLARRRHQFGRWCFASRQRGSQRVATRERGGNGQRGGRPLARVRIQAAQHHPLHRRVQFPHQRGQAGRLGLLLQAHQVHQRAGFEGALAGEQFIQQQAQRVNIALESDLGTRQLFRRHISRSAAAHVALQLGAQTRQPEVHNHGLAAAVDHDVGWFQVAMQDAFFVRGGETGADLPRDFDGLIHRQPADAAQQHRQVLAIDILHRDELEAIDLADVVYAAHVGVRDLAGDAYLVVEARQRAIVARSGFRQELERHGLAQGQIGGAVHLAHAAAAQQAGDAIARRQQGSGQETAFIHRARGRQHGV